MSNDDSSTREALHAAWDDLIRSLEEARDAIDRPELMPAPPTDRNLAEGYRYLMGYVHSAVERAFHSDPDRPHFRNALSIVNRATIDNADAIYFFAPIDGSKSYVLRGQVGDARHWRGEAAAISGPKAPHYMIFEASWGALAGDSGELSELRPGMKTQTGRLDSSSIRVEPDGSFEIVFAPERPAGHNGNFVSTLKIVRQPHPTDPDAPVERYATYVSGRQLFCDWEREEPVHFDMVQIGAEGTHPPPYGPEQAAAELRACGELVRNQMRFWNAFWTIPMGSYGHVRGSIPGVAFDRNEFNTVNAASGATGGGMSTNLYAGTIASLAPDEALLIENRIPGTPQYIGFQLGNPWGESIEYADHLGSLNGHQLEADDDGVIRVVVAHEDPGVPNWLDTTGHPEVFVAPRWAYSETPPKEEWPTVTATKTKLADLRDHLPAGTRVVSAEERRKVIAARQEHVKRRFRVF